MPTHRSYWSTATTTCSRSIRWSCGTPTRSTRPSTATCCAPVARPTTRDNCCSTCSGCVRTWPRPDAIRRRSRSSCSSRVRRSPARRTSKSCIDERRDRLDADVVVITDTGVLAPDVPSTVTGMRGLVGCTVRFHGPDLDLHSGAFGGAVPNPATAIARLVAGFHDEHGRVQVPGFYDDVLELTEDERELFAKLPSDDGEFLKVAKSRALFGEHGFTTARAARRASDGRGQRHRRRLPGRRRQDHRPERRLRQAVVPPGREPGPGQDHRRRRPARARTHAGRNRRRRRMGGRRCSAVHRPAGHAGLRGAHRRVERGLRRTSGAADPRRRQLARKLHCSTRSARRWCSSASRSRTTRSTRRTRR